MSQFIAEGDRGRGLLGVRGDVKEVIDVTLAPVVKTPVLTDASLEPGRIVPRGLEGWMAPVFEEHGELLAEEPPHFRRGLD